MHQTRTLFTTCNHETNTSDSSVLVLRRWWKNTVDGFCQKNMQKMEVCILLGCRVKSPLGASQVTPWRVQYHCWKKPPPSFAYQYNIVKPSSLFPKNAAVVQSYTGGWKGNSWRKTLKMETHTCHKQRTNQPTKQATKQPGNQATKQPGNQATKQPGNQPSNQANSQATNQATNQPTNKKTNKHHKHHKQYKHHNKNGKKIYPPTLFFFVGTSCPIELNWSLSKGSKGATCNHSRWILGSSQWIEVPWEAWNEPSDDVYWRWEWMRHDKKWNSISTGYFYVRWSAKGLKKDTNKSTLLLSGYSRCDNPNHHNFYDLINQLI